MVSSQVNLSGFNVGENNTSTGKRLSGEARKIVLGINAAEQRERKVILKTLSGSRIAYGGERFVQGD